MSFGKKMLASKVPSRAPSHIDLEGQPIYSQRSKTDKSHMGSTRNTKGLIREIESLDEEILYLQVGVVLHFDKWKE